MLLIYTIEDTMKKIHSLALISLFMLTACGGGGGGDGSSQTTSGNSVLSGVTSFSGVAIDGYLANAIVFLDLNNNGTFDSGEPNTYTDSKGNYTLQATQSQMSHSSVVINAIDGKTIDLDSNTTVSKSYTLTAPNGVYSVVSPLTSMVVAQMKLTPTLTADQAQQSLANSFGISTSDISSNYIATGKQPVHNIAAVSALQLQQQSSSSPLSTQLTNALTQMNGISSYLPTVSKMSNTSAALSTVSSLTNYHQVLGKVTTLEQFVTTNLYPNFLAVDQNNNLYWDSVISGGMTTSKIYSSFIGSGNFSAITNSPSLNASGLVTDANGNIFVVDTGNCVIKKVTPNGTVSIIAGSDTSSTCGHNSANGGGTLVDDPASGTAARFWHPIGIAMDPSGNGVLYVSDFNNQAIRKLTPNAAYGGYSVKTIAGSQPSQKADGSSPCVVNQYLNTAGSCQGYLNSPDGLSALFAGPSGIAVDINGNVYVSETLNNTIRKLSPSTSGTTTTYSVTTLAGPPPPTNGVIYDLNDILLSSAGYVDTSASGARFDNPLAIAVDVKCVVYIVDNQNNRIRKVDPLGNVTTLAGSGSALTTDGTGVAASFSSPSSIVIDGNNNLYISEYRALRKIK